MEFYNKRNGLMSSEKNSISLDELKHYWFEIYKYFREDGCLQLAEDGVRIGTNQLPLKMAPSPEQFLFSHVGRKKLYPITEKSINQCSQSDMFTLIEIYYNQLERCTWSPNEIGIFEWRHEKDDIREKYCECSNNILQFYEDGFYLEPSHGFIMQKPNEALQQQLQTKAQEVPDNIYEIMSNAAKNYYRFDANFDGKQQAIATLARILEPLRKEMKEVFNAEYNIAKNAQDKLIFGIVNDFSIRHNNNTQKNDYSKEIWFDWMMQYYTSVIIAFYRLKAKHNEVKKECQD